MARPQKDGIDYFPLNVDIDQDDKMLLIEAEHGIQGFGIIVRLLMKIYKEGYYYLWTEREQLLFSKSINVDINSLNVVINDAIKWDFFNQEIYEKYQVLTSRGIQKRYIEAVKRRKQINMIEEYALINPAEYKDKIRIFLVSANNKPINDNNNLVNVIINSERKEKKRKVKESKQLQESGESCENIFKLFESEFARLLSPMEIDEIKQLEAEWGFDLLHEALKRAVIHNKRYLSYIGGILDRWKGANIKTVFEVQVYEQDFEQNKKAPIAKNKESPVIDSAKKEKIKSLYNL